MPPLLLSDIKTDLEKCSALGAIGFNDFGHGYRLNLKLPGAGYIFLGIETEIEITEQALIIATLEQFAESRGKYLEPFRVSSAYECAVHDSVTDDVDVRTEKRYDTKLQATLAAFLAVDWRK